MLGYFDLVFLQDQASLTLLTQLGYGERAMVAGDTRYDRVAEIASGGHRIEQIASFQSNCHLIIGGSTWPEEEAILSKVLDSIPSDWKMIIAPHEIDPPHLARVNQAFGKEAVFFSEWKKDSLTDKRRVLIMDNMGMLSRLYRYGTIAFIGGGFRKGGIHNILEPAVFGLPVVFGPVYKKFVEATQLVSRDLAFSVRDAEEAKSLLNRLAGDEAWRSRIRESLKGFVNQQVGSTTLICAELLRRNWLMP
jgi:3-deoxy-D-manno-octulosonic-acid transferase